MSLRPTVPDLVRTVGISSTEDTRLICRVPWTDLSQHAFPFSGRGTSDGSRYDCRRSIRFGFSWAPEIDQTPIQGPFRPSPGSHHEDTPQASAVSHFRGWPVPKRRQNSLRRRAYFCSTGILTCFPFDAFQLGCTLGSTNPQLITIAEEPWPFRRLSFLPSSAVTIGKILIFAGSTRSHDRISAPAKHLPTSPFGDRGLGSLFSPVHFQSI